MCQGDCWPARRPRLEIRSDVTRNRRLDVTYARSVYLFAPGPGNAHTRAPQLALSHAASKGQSRDTRRCHRGAARSRRDNSRSPSVPARAALHSVADCGRGGPATPPPPPPLLRVSAAGVRHSPVPAMAFMCYFIILGACYVESECCMMG